MMYQDIIKRPIISENSMEDVANKRADWKKAIVTLKPDSKTIEFFDGMA